MAREKGWINGLCGAVEVGVEGLSGDATRAALVCFYFLSYPANVCCVYCAEWWLGFHNACGRKVQSDQLSTEWPVRFLKGWCKGGGQLWLLVLLAELQQRLTGPASVGRRSCGWAQAVLFPATVADF